MIFYDELINQKARIIIQFIKFSLVGISNTAISLAIYYLLLTISMNYIIANTIAFIISVLNSYLLNNRLVFKKSEPGHFKPLVKTYLSYGITFMLGTLLLYLMVDYMGISSLIAPIINLVVTIPLNFLFIKYWAFN